MKKGHGKSSHSKRQIRAGSPPIHKSETAPSPRSLAAIFSDCGIELNPEQVEHYRAADPAKQPKMLGFFVGQIMKKSQGKANPQQVNELLRKKLS